MRLFILFVSCIVLANRILVAEHPQVDGEPADLLIGLE